MYSFCVNPFARRGKKELCCKMFSYFGRCEYIGQAN